MVSRSATELFRLRLLQLGRTPFPYLLCLFSLCLVSLSTFSGPLPPTNNGLAWRELTLASQTLVAWIYGLFLAQNRSGRLLDHLPTLPLTPTLARFWWACAESLLAPVILLPGFLLFFIVLPGSIQTMDLLVAGLVLVQAAALATLGGTLRDLTTPRGAALPAMVACWIIIFLPPLSAAGARHLLNTRTPSLVPLLGGILVWSGLWALLTGTRTLMAGSYRK